MWYTIFGGRKGDGWWVIKIFPGKLMCVHHGAPHRMARSIAGRFSFLSPGTIFPTSRGLSRVPLQGQPGPRRFICNYTTRHMTHIPSCPERERPLQLGYACVTTVHRSQQTQRQQCSGKSSQNTAVASPQFVVRTHHLRRPQDTNHCTNASLPTITL